MAFSFRYDVQVMEDGKLVTKKRFAAKDAAVNFAADKLVRRRRVRIARQRVFTLETHQNTEWGLSAHQPWVSTPGNLKEVFVHHSVTAQLPVSATVEQEKAQMRLLDQIAHSRDFNGISYSWAIFPSGRCWEGRGWLVVEAATIDHNTSGDSIVLVGNYSSFAMSAEQKVAIRKLINKAQEAGVFVNTGLDVRPHRSVSSTSCPGTKVTNDYLAGLQKSVNA